MVLRLIIESKAGRVNRIRQEKINYKKSGMTSASYFYFSSHLAAAKLQVTR